MYADEDLVLEDLVMTGRGEVEALEVNWLVATPSSCGNYRLRAIPNDIDGEFENGDRWKRWVSVPHTIIQQLHDFFMEHCNVLNPVVR